MTLTGTEYVALAWVLTRPPGGLGALVAGAIALEIACPTFNFNNSLRGRVLALTADREVEEWVLTTNEIGLPARMADGDFLGTIDRRSMKLGHCGVVAVRADWDHGPGWVPRRGLGDWEAVAGTQPASAFGPRY